MSINKTYSIEFKKTIVNLYHSGKSYSQIHAEYGVSSSALSKMGKALQKRNAQLEEENLVLKKAIAIFTPHSDKD